MTTETTPTMTVIDLALEGLGTLPTDATWSTRRMVAALARSDLFVLIPHYLDGLCRCSDDGSCTIDCFDCEIEDGLCLTCAPDRPWFAPEIPALAREASIAATWARAMFAADDGVRASIAALDQPAR